jgi:hypothetical protein
VCCCLAQQLPGATDCPHGSFVSEGGCSGKPEKHHPNAAAPPPPAGFCCCCSCWEAVAIRSCSHDKIESSQHDTII